MSTACMVAGAIIVLAVAQLFLQKDAPVYAVLVSLQRSFSCCCS